MLFTLAALIGFCSTPSFSPSRSLSGRCASFGSIASCTRSAVRSCGSWPVSITTGSPTPRASGEHPCWSPLNERRDQFVAPYFRGAQPDPVVALHKARGPARMLVSLSKQVPPQGPLVYKLRWVDPYHFCLQERDWGRLVVRVCPSFPCSARLYFNPHAGLAQRLEASGIRFRACAHALLTCRDPQPLQRLADSLQPQDLAPSAPTLLARRVPFCKPLERREGGCWHRLFLAPNENKIPVAPRITA